ncbi:hypothetical protein NO135_20135, partial [Clostridioides difficile]|nr:hypothetical protein [Clostridioides difficile]
FSHGVRRLLEFWEPLRADYVYRTDWLGIAAAGARWLAAMTFGWAARRSPRGLLANAPLAHLLQRELSFHRIEQMLEARLLHALAVTALSVSSGRPYRCRSTSRSSTMPMSAAVANDTGTATSGYQSNAPGA